MLKFFWRATVTLLLTGFLISTGKVVAQDAVVDEPGIGSAKFYPSDTRPIGYRGDGNGYYPEATVPAQWWSGTPIDKKKPAGTFDPKKDKGVYVDFADSIPHNVLWKTQLPSWANTQPLVVGDKIFTTGEPDYLICVDAQSGKVLWTRQVSPWDLIGLDAAKAKKIRDLYDISLAVEDFMGLEFHFNTCGRYFTLEKYKPMADTFIEKSLPNMLLKLKEIDPGGQYDDPAKKTVDGLRAFMADWKPSGQGYEKNVGQLEAAIDRRIQSLQGSVKELKSQPRGFSLGMPWGNIVGFCPSSPVSDGKYVYVSMGQGQTACYDLDGNRIWARIIDGPAPSTFQVISPVFCGDVFIDTHGHDMLRGLNKKTGETIWETNIRPPVAGGGYHIASHKIVHLSNGKDEMDVLVTSPTAVLRVSDGKVLGFLPYSSKPYGGSSIISKDNIVIKTCNGDGYNGPFEAFKLTMVDKDTLDITKIWGYPAGNSNGYFPHTVVGDYAYVDSRAGKVFDVNTGKATVSANVQIGKESDIAVGNKFFWTQNGSKQWYGRREDGKVLQCFYAADITNPASPRIVSTSNWLGGMDPVACSYIHTYLPELEFNPEFYNLKGGNPAHFAYADTEASAHGNRLFIRSVGYLYCIGDPTETYCNQSYPVGDILLDEPKAENLDAIVAKLSSTDRQVQLAAAVALRKLGKDAAPATDALLKLFTSDDEKEAVAGYLGLRALQKNAAKAVDTLVEFGKKGPVQKVRATAIMADI